MNESKIKRMVELSLMRYRITMASRLEDMDASSITKAYFMYIVHYAVDDIYVNRFDETTTTFCVIVEGKKYIVHLFNCSIVVRRITLIDNFVLSNKSMRVK